MVRACALLFPPFIKDNKINFLNLGNSGFLWKSLCMHADFAHMSSKEEYELDCYCSASYLHIKGSIEWQGAHLYSQGIIGMLIKANV